MSINECIKQVESSQEFKKFRKEHPKSYLGAGFFVLDFESKKHVKQLDYVVPNSGKSAIFKIEENILLEMSDSPNPNANLEEIKGRIKLDFGALQKIIEAEMKKNKILQDITKMIVVLQSENKKNVWKVSCLTKAMALIKANIDDETSKAECFEKTSMFDFMKQVK